MCISAPPILSAFAAHIKQWLMPLLYATEPRFFVHNGEVQQVQEVILRLPDSHPYK